MALWDTSFTFTGWGLNCVVKLGPNLCGIRILLNYFHCFSNRIFSTWGVRLDSPEGEDFAPAALLAG